MPDLVVDMGYADLIALYDKQNKEKEGDLRNELRNTIIIKHSIETTIMGALGAEGELPSLAEYFDQFGVGTGETIKEDVRTIEELMADIDAAFEEDE